MASGCACCVYRSVGPIDHEVNIKGCALNIAVLKVNVNIKGCALNIVVLMLKAISKDVL